MVVRSRVGALNSQAENSSKPISSSRFHRSRLESTYSSTPSRSAAASPAGQTFSAGRYPHPILYASTDGGSPSTPQASLPVTSFSRRFSHGIDPRDRAAESSGLTHKVRGSPSPPLSPASTAAQQDDFDNNEVFAYGREDHGQTGMLLRLSANGTITVAGIVSDGAADRTGVRE